MIKKVAKAIAPPILVAAVRHFRAGRHPDPKAITFTGDYACWADAQRNSAGWDSAVILQKTRDALLKVKRGEAVYERDSIIFDEMQHSFPLLAGLLRAATASGSRLSVLDFGGSLGSTYFQCRSFLSVAKELRWSVVEQPTHVACVEFEFTNDQLRFYPSIEECLRIEKPNVLLLSSVIQYLPRPYDFLADALRHGFDYVIIDRTAFMGNGQDRLTVQHVPASIYKASYPAWFLSEKRFRACFDERYELVYEFAGADTVQPDGGETYFKGFQFQIKAEAQQA